MAAKRAKTTGNIRRAEPKITPPPKIVLPVDKQHKLKVKPLPKVQKN